MLQGIALQGIVLKGIDFFSLLLNDLETKEKNFKVGWRIMKGLSQFGA
jgi:hypothetical protein